MSYDLKGQIVLRGLIVPTQWDKNGSVVRIAIAGFDEREHPILMDTVGIRLIALLREEVIIMGRRIKIENIDFIKVERFNKDSIINGS